jgi:hypothetical protein
MSTILFGCVVFGGDEEVDPCVCVCLLLRQQIVKTVVVAAMLAGLIPLLLGLLFELVVVAPLRVPLAQTPLFYPWQVTSASGPGPLGVSPGKLLPRSQGL